VCEFEVHAKVVKKAACRFLHNLKAACRLGSSSLLSVYFSMIQTVRLISAPKHSIWVTQNALKKITAVVEKLRIYVSAIMIFHQSTLIASMAQNIGIELSSALVRPEIWTEPRQRYVTFLLTT
jgi:hypothetical protein